ncbi:MAG TPA: DUF6786 family protein [Planctomycetota bacterium]|nr:DUF6786 family protein [Planctomycetota bacterium]
MRIPSPVLALIAFAPACAAPDGMTSPGRERTYGEDRDFLAAHADCIELVDATGRARVAVVGAYQGRVMTSTARGEGGRSHGFIRYEAVASPSTVPHINVYGGEDRFWLGPEGGQFGLFFAPGDPFDFAHWQTPAVIDTEPFELVERAARHARFTRIAELRNWSGTRFTVRIDRTVRLLDGAEIEGLLGIALPAGVDAVGFATDNTLTNDGAAPWRKDTGQLSIWILGMLKPSPRTTVVVPIRPGPEDRLGPKVNDRYFGEVPEDRLVARDDVLFFAGDGRLRGKIGVGPRRAQPRLGSYDAERGVLTVVQFNLPPDTAEYVDSMWEMQADPYGGDVVNSYNDGPPAPGVPPLGPFYELETSSPALALDPGGSFTHTSTTLHFEGPPEALDPIARICLGVDLATITSALPRADR